MNKRKKAILLTNLGTPDSPSRKDVYKYLKQFLLDPRVIDIPWFFRQLLVRGVIAPFRSGSSSKLYQQLWTEDGSPLKYYGEIAAQLLQEKLGDDYHVELAMRYQNPSIEKGLEKIRTINPDEIIVLPLFPHYASASTGSVHEEVMRITSKWLAIPSIRMISSYHDHPKLINVFAKNAEKMDYQSYEHYLFSFHGLPQSQLKKSDNCNHCLKSADCCQTISDRNYLCYSAQCFDTAKLIAERLNIPKEKYTVCFQSRLGPDKWTQPFTPDIIEEQEKAGVKNLLVFSPAFVADCLETIIEIGFEYKEEFIEAGGEKLDLVPSLNDDPEWIECLEDLIVTSN